MPRPNTSLGFSKAINGAHSARSMMFLEMNTLVRAMPINATKDDFTKAIIEENALDKPTLSSQDPFLHSRLERTESQP